MFERFSRGYYLGRLYVEPRKAERAAMSSEQLDAIDRQLYRDAEPGTRDRPVVMKVGRRHYRVQGDRGVPNGELAIPRSATEIEGAGHRPVLLAKAGRADQLAGFTDDDPESSHAGTPFVPDAIRDVPRPDVS